jgi:diguanylate cyclase (GGDEF)-like protein
MPAEQPAGSTGRFKKNLRSVDTSGMAAWNSRRRRIELWVLARVRTSRSRAGLLALVAVGSALASLAVCALTYWATGVQPTASVDRFVAYGLPVIVPLVMSPLVLWQILKLAAVLHERSQQLETEVHLRRRAEARLAILVTTDELTQVPNRRAFFARAVEISAGTGQISTVAVLDIDQFKLLNDTHGHAAGDEALRSGAAMIRERVDPVGVVARLGGEEFGIIVPGRHPAETRALLDDIRASFAQVRSGLTASIGASDWHPGEVIDLALARADAALYRAKQRGRNRVEISRADESGGGIATDLAPVARR